MPASPKTRARSTLVNTPTKANDRQIGGDHYKKGEGEEHWDRVWRMHGPGYFVGCITKYVERYQDKNGVEDLQKAQHFLEKLIELETEEEAKSVR
jgi:hypothetical protein